MHLPAVPTRTGADATLNFDAVRKQVVELVKRVTNLDKDSGWITIGAAGAPAFENTWKAGVVAPAYRKVGKVVRLRGRLATGIALKAAFTLPAEFRPAAEAYYTVAVGVVATQNNIVVATAGTVTPIAAGEEPSLDGITFTVD